MESTQCAAPVARSREFAAPQTAAPQRDLPPLPPQSLAQPACHLVKAKLGSAYL